MNHRKIYISLGFLISFAACSSVDVSGLDPSQFSSLNGASGNPAILAQCTDVSYKFSVDILPYFQSNCGNGLCHLDGKSQGTLNLDDNDQSKGDGPSGVIGNIIGNGDIDGFSAAQSNILTYPLNSAEGGNSANHTGGQFFASTSDDTYKKLLCWVAAGAPDDLSSSKCTFGRDVYPIFHERGCSASGCHTTANFAIAGGMDLSQDSVSLVSATGTHGFLDLNPPVIDTDNPENSALLTKPLAGTNTHQGGDIFANVNDPDYQTMLCWIKEGALNN